MKYVIINWKKDENYIFPRAEEQSIFKIEDGRDNACFICDNCFRIFNTNNLTHLNNCNLVWPYDGYGYKLCKEIPESVIRIYRIDKEGTSINNQIVRAIANLGNLSKQEQELDLSISTRGIIGYPHDTPYYTSRFYYYVLFCYKKIISYVLIQVYSDKEIPEKTNVIVRDIYTFPIYRNQGYADLLFSEITKQHDKHINEFIFSAPVTEKLKSFLRKSGLKEFKTVQGENFQRLQFEEL